MLLTHVPGLTVRSYDVCRQLGIEDTEELAENFRFVIRSAGPKTVQELALVLLYQQAQQLIDQYEDYLANRYGWDAVLSAPVYDEGDTPFPSEELTALKELYRLRDAIDS